MSSLGDWENDVVIGRNYRVKSKTGSRKSQSDEFSYQLKRNSWK